MAYPFACFFFTLVWLSDLDATNSRSSYTFPKQLEADQPERGSLSAEAEQAKSSEVVGSSVSIGRWVVRIRIRQDHIAFVYGVTWRS